MAKEILLLSLMTMAYCKDDATFPVYNVLGRNTWLTGFNDCIYTMNSTMASADDIEDRKKTDIEFASELAKYLPVWTYAFEVTLKSTGETFRIKSNGISYKMIGYTCSNGDMFETQCCASLIRAQSLCKRKHLNLDIPEIHPKTLNRFAERLYINASLWGYITDENEFLHATTHAVFQYVGQSKIPRYTKPTTERQTSNVAGTGVSIGVVIIVCISAVMLVILAVVLTILIMKKRSMIQETHQRGVEYVAEQTNGNTPTNNEAGHVYESADERHDEEHSSRSPNTQGSAYESLGERHNDEHSYGSPNTQRSPYESLGERHDEEHGYGTPNTQRSAYESLGERHSQKHSYGTPALATSGVYQPIEEEIVDTHTTTKITNYSRKSEYDSLGDKTTETHPN